MSHYHEVYVVMAGLIALTPVDPDELKQRPEAGDSDRRNTNPSDNNKQPQCTPKSKVKAYMAMFVRDPGHDLHGRIYGLDDQVGDRVLPLKNRRLQFGWGGSSAAKKLAICGFPYGSNKKDLSDPPKTADEAKAFCWVPCINDALPEGRYSTVDPQCVDQDPIKREVGAQVLLDEGELCTGHLVELGGLSPELYFQRRTKTPKGPVRKTCADVMILKLVPPESENRLRIKARLLDDLDGSPISHDFPLSGHRPIVISLTNQARPVPRIPRVASHFKLYGQLLKKPVSSMFLPRLEPNGGRYTTVQPGFDFGGFEALTPPSVDNRPMCPFTEIPGP